MNETLSIQEHCYRLREFLICSNNDNFILTSDWLLLASSIESIEIDIDKYDSSWFKCNAAYEYDEANQKLLEKFTRELSIFNFIWCSIESIIDSVKPPDHPVKNIKGKIRNIAFYLNKNLEQSKIIDAYLDNVYQFKILAFDFLKQENIEKN